MRGVERDVSFYQSSEPAIAGTHHRALPSPKHSVMNEETVGMLLGGQSDRGLAQVHSGGEAGDVTCVADLQTIQRLGCVGDLSGDMEIVIEKTHQTF